jgi:hypothetical protein
MQLLSLYCTVVNSFFPGRLHALRLFGQELRDQAECIKPFAPAAFRVRRVPIARSKTALPQCSVSAAPALALAAQSLSVPPDSQ